MNIRARLLLISISFLCAACSTSFVVNSSGDEPDANLGNNTCDTANNECTLRAAIQEANTTNTSDTITFENVSQISLNSALPPLTGSNIAIDGAGEVTLDGGQAGGCGGFDGLDLQSSYNIIQGLTLVNFSAGVRVGGNVSAEYNIIGTNPNVQPDGTEGNVLSGNCYGIYMNGAGTAYTTVAGNKIGTLADGATANPNSFAGIVMINGTNNNIIGSTESMGQSLVDPTGLVAHWAMEESSGTRMDSVGANDLTESGSIASASGLVGNAADLEANNNQDLSIADNSDLSLGNDSAFTFSVWVKPESVASGMIILKKQPGGNATTEYKIALSSSSQPRLRVGNGSTSSVVTWGAPLVAGNWYHIVAWHDPSSDEIGISVNGGTAVTSSYSGGTHDTAAGFFIGSNGSGGDNWDGLIDEVAFWKRTLNSQEIGLLYNNGSGLPYGASGLGRNIISGNDGPGIQLQNSSDNHISGNFIGVAANGGTQLSNTGSGVYITGGSDNNYVGLNANGDGRGNVISGNGGDGVHIQASDNNMIAGNFIGTSFDGSAAIGNAHHGVNLIAAATGNVIGTNGDGVSDELEGNVISGNGAQYLRSGVRIDTQNNTVAGNKIGTDASGSYVLPNNGIGVGLVGSGNLVGTNGDGVSDELERNIISGNTTTGVHIFGLGNRVSGNYIGTNAAGTLGLGNGASGVAIANNSPFNTIGTNGDGIGDAQEGNVISGNGFGITGSAGIRIGGYTNTIAGNLIGLTANGMNALGNAQYGITLNQYAFDNFIGTDGDGVSDAEERNVISGNPWMGIFLHGSTSNYIAGNLIGTDINGTSAIPNTSGINELVGAIELRAGSNNNVIGTNGNGSGDAAEGNVISGNTHRGIVINGSSNNTVAGNYIGVDISGTVALGNGQLGIELSQGANQNVIGTDDNGVSDALEANVISGNGSTGIQIIIASSNQISGNFIGTDVSGTLPIGNAFHGITIEGSDTGVTNNNVIGGNMDKANVIAYNQGVGVRVGGSGVNPLYNPITFNSIHSNGQLGIDLSSGGSQSQVTLNDPGDGDSGGNDLLNFPDLSNALSINNSVTISGGIVNGLPNTNFTIQFFSNPQCDQPSTYGEGEVYLGETTVTTDGSGNAGFLANLAVAVTPGEFISSTATETNAGNTSEFSPCVEIEAGQQQSQEDVEFGPGLVIIPNRDLNCRYYCTSQADIADTLLEGIQYIPLGWDANTGFLAFEGPSFGELCFAPPQAGGTSFMDLQYNGELVSVEDLSTEIVEVYGCPVFPTPTPTLDPDEGSSADPTPTPTSVPECSDGIDNDGDGLIDYSAAGGGDRECTSANDNSETR